MSFRDHSHTPEAIAERLSKGPRVHYLREWVYGGIDGVVTTFAIVAAVIGASLSPLIVLVLGLANLIGDGFSMAAGSYSSTKAEEDKYERLRRQEERHIEKFPEGEREETRQILAAKGYADEELEEMIGIISKDKDIWIDFMLAEEYGASRPAYGPVKAALNTFAAFVVCGAAPLVPFMFSMEDSPRWALIFAALTFFAIGSVKSFWSVKPWWREGLATMLIGLTAAGLAFGIGYGLRGLAP